MTSVRSYQQFCALARALDVIGDRWTLLLVRELAISPARYVDLRDGLPGIATNLLAVQHDDSLGELFAMDSVQRRRSVTSSRNALNGYQKGRCFYCLADLQLMGERMNADVDHFFPHRLKKDNLGVNLDGVWNLVLACPACNRGPRGKFDRIPSTRLLERLHLRNEYLIGSHHPLRETLMKQTGVQPGQRVAFLNQLYKTVQLSPALAWEPDFLFAP